MLKTTLTHYLIDSIIKSFKPDMKEAIPEGISDLCIMYKDVPSPKIPYMGYVIYKGNMHEVCICFSNNETEDGGILLLFMDSFTTIDKIQGLKNQGYESVIEINDNFDNLGFYDLKETVKFHIEYRSGLDLAEVR